MTNITVETRHPDGHRDIVVIDHDDRASRSWLGKHCFWAFRNGRQITTGPTCNPVSYRPVSADEAA